MRLIDADALKERFHEELEIDCAENDDYGNGFQDGVLTVDSAPTIEAEPVVHAHWIKSKWDTSSWQRCSKCCEKSIEGFDFCPNCGAKMDEEEL